jgi:hypothetical protein
LFYVMQTIPAKAGLHAGNMKLSTQSYRITGLDRPLGFQEVGTVRIYRQSAHEGGKVDGPRHRPPFPHQVLGTHFC